MKTIASAIVSFVGAFFPLHSNPRLGLSFVVSGDFNDYGYDKKGNTKVRPEFRYATKVHLLITRPMNNARVYGATHEYTSRVDRQYPGVWPMEFLSSHNSCWREAIEQYLREAEGVGIEKYYNQPEDKTRPRWNEIHHMVGFDLFERPTFVLLGEHPWEKRLVYDDTYTSERLVEITVEKPLVTCEAAEYMNKNPSNYTAWM